jgi:hypothetical protein
MVAGGLVAELGLTDPGAGDDEIIMRSHTAILLEVSGAEHGTTPPS